MKLAIFGKKRTTKEGKAFMTYLTTLTKKDGTEVKCSVKFREECGAPADLPRFILVEKKNANLSEETYDTADGLTAVSRTLWVNAWTDGGEYIDTSLDDFED